MKIVVLDGYVENPGDITWEPLEAVGELTVYDSCSQDKDLIVERMGDAEILITNKTVITPEIMDACENLKAICILATGYNVIDVDYAAKKKIPVMNVPAYGTNNVAQFTVCMLLELCCMIGDHNRSVHRGDWAVSGEFSYWLKPLVEVASKTVGIIGLGRIGMATARVLKALNMHVIAYSRTRKAEAEDVVTYVELDELLAASDFILLHCPLFPETEGIINKDTIAKMKDGVFLVNTSRGGLVVEQDLADALASGKIAGAALDVVSSEPITEENPLLHAPNCMITPHIAWATVEARVRIMQTTAENIRCFAEGHAQNVVNPWE